MKYLILASAATVILLTLIKVFKLKLYSPAIIFTGGYLISFLLSFIGTFTWNTENHNMLWLTLGIILTGIIAFCGGDIIAEKTTLFKHNKKIGSKDPRNKFSYILATLRAKQDKIKKRFRIGKTFYINNIVYFISIIIFLLTIILIIFDLKYICNINHCSATGLPQLISFYRSKSDLFSTNGATFNFFTSQFIKLCSISTLIYMYVFINNLINKETIKSNAKYLLPIGLFLIITLLQSGRGLILVYVVAAIILFMSLYTKKHHNNKQTNLNLIKKIVPVIAIVLILFYAISPLIGRSAKNSFTDYTTFYFGCSTPSLNVALRKNIKPNSMNYIGENTFRGLYNALNKVKLIDYKPARSMPFIAISGMYSNVFTHTYRSYFEFGILGVLILSFVAGFCFGKIYKLAEDKNDYRFLLFYAFCGANILDMFRDETFYTSVISTATIANIVIIAILCEIVALTQASKSETPKGTKK